jgi:hypothetical protein
MCEKRREQAGSTEDVRTAVDTWEVGRGTCAAGSGECVRRAMRSRFC